MKKKSQQYWMQIALEEARQGLGYTSPNPMVGAVLVKNNRRVATGYHRKAGLPHAEVEALQACKNPRGSTLYVTLEPCCHLKKRTPPCTQAIIASGVEKVIVGTLDPNPQVAGQGIQQLQAAGIAVESGILEQECRELNRFYNHWICSQRPWVILKVASSLDGRIALANGQSRWITNATSRQRVYELRAQVDAILVGSGTVLHDNPQLTARLDAPRSQELRHPQPIVLDPYLETSPQARVYQLERDLPCLVFTQKNPPLRKKQAFLKTKLQNKLELIEMPLKKNGLFSLKNLIKILGQRGITSLMVEGGSGVWTEFYQEKCFHELWYFIAGKVLGADAKPAFADLHLKSLKGAHFLELKNSEVLDSDLLLRFSNSQMH